MAGRPRTVNREAALQALWGRTSAEAAAQLGCSAGHLRRILAGLPDGMRAAYRVALAARQALEAMPDCTQVRQSALKLNALAAERCAVAMLESGAWELAAVE